MSAANKETMLLDENCSQVVTLFLSTLAARHIFCDKQLMTHSIHDCA